jgi:single-stranded DNA-specific DHH superfamily exonuclease
MYEPEMKSFWVDFPLNAEQYSKLDIRWRRRKNYYEIKNPPPDLRIRSFCTFGGDDFQVISLEARGNIDEYAHVLEVMDKWIRETLGEY